MDDDWRPAFRVDGDPVVQGAPAWPTPATTRGGARRAVAAGADHRRGARRRSASPCFGVDGYEADDVIGTLATARRRGPVDVVTGDRDLFQLVDDARARAGPLHARGVGRARGRSTRPRSTAKYGIPGRAYADFATLRGDPSDGLPGVAGIGDKTAAALITKYGDLRGTARGASTPATARCRRARAPSSTPAATTWRSRRWSSRSRTTCRCRRTTTRSRASPRDPERLVELSRALGTRQPAQPGAERLRSRARRVTDQGHASSRQSALRAADGRAGCQGAGCRRVGRGSAAPIDRASRLAAGTWSLAFRSPVRGSGAAPASECRSRAILARVADGLD